MSLWSHFVLKAARMGQAGTVARVWVQAMKHQGTEGEATRTDYLEIKEMEMNGSTTYIVCCAGEDERGCSVDLFKGLALPCLEGVMVELIRYGVIRLIAWDCLWIGWFMGK